MLNTYRSSLLFMLVVFLAACATPVTPVPPPSTLPEARIARHPGTDNYRKMNTYAEVPKYDPNSTDPFLFDLRCSNLTKLDLSKSTVELQYADFDSKTQWPPSDKMPANFDWQKIMEIGKDPGLGIRTLHAQGVTGKGIGIAIIDQTLLVDHIEYVDHLQLYEEPEIYDRGKLSSMHGPALASIAVGKTVGVAPEADLYYIAAPYCFEHDDFACLARSVRRIIEINKTLPSDRKIRALVIARGWGPDASGYADIMAAIKEASAEGIFVISSSLSDTHDLHFHGMGRDSLADPNKFESYLPGLWWQEEFYTYGLPTDRLLVPMDSRTTASQAGAEEYAFYYSGGWSWSIPYLGGMYALAVQVEPDITPEEFWETALQTGRTIQLQHDGKEYEFGVILDPQALIAAIKSK